MSPSLPYSGVTTVTARRYAVTTHERCSRPPSSPTIVGSAVDTIVWSSDASSMTSIRPLTTSRIERRSAGRSPSTAAVAAVLIPALLPGALGFVVERSAILDGRLPVRVGALDVLAVDGERHRVALVEEAHRLLDLRALGPRGRIRPHDVLVLGAADLRRVVARDALVRARALRVGGDEQVEAHVAARDVPAGRQAGLEEKERAAGLGDRLTVDLDLHVA